MGQAARRARTAAFGRAERPLSYQAPEKRQRTTSCASLGWYSSTIYAQATTNLFREKREWFRYFFFPTLMKVR